MIARFGADALVVSLGVDTAAEDYDTFQLGADDFTPHGRRDRRAGLPTVLVQEGGYDLGVIGRNVVNVLQRVRGRVTPSDHGKCWISTANGSRGSGSGTDSIAVVSPSTAIRGALRAGSASSRGPELLGIVGAIATTIPKCS